MKKNNNYLIYISPIKIRDYDWQNRELGVLEKKKIKDYLTRNCRDYSSRFYKNISKSLR